MISFLHGGNRLMAQVLNKIKEFVVRHQDAIVVAAAFSLVYGSFHIFVQQKISATGERYAPVVVEGNYDEGYYALRAAEFFAGDRIVGDINLLEYPDTPAFLPMGNPLILGSLGGILGSIDRAFIVSDFVFPPIIFLFVYLIFRELCVRRDAAIAASAVFMVIPRFGLFPAPGTFSFLDGVQSLYFSRFDYPSITFLFFAGALYFILRTVQRSDVLSPYGAGVFTGSLFYTYMYDWTYVVGGLFLLIPILLLQRNFGAVKRVALCISVAAVISMPYWINTVSLSAIPTFPDLMERVGIEKGRSFRLEVVWPTYVRALGLTVLVWMIGALRRRKGLIAFLTAYLLPIIVLLNLQLITGFVPHPDHWHRTQFLILAATLTVIGLEFVRSYEFAFSRLPHALMRTVPIVLVGTSLVWGLYSQEVLAARQFKEFTLDPSHRAAYEWLKENTPRDSVVGVLSPRTNDEIILYTDNNIFVPNGLHTVAPTDEIWRRSMALARTLGLSGEEFRSYVGSSVLYLFVDAYRNAEFNSYMKSTVRKVPEDILNERVEEYFGLEKSDIFALPHSLDFVLVSSRDRGFGVDDTYIGSVGREVYRNDDVVIYAVNE